MWIQNVNEAIEVSNKIVTIRVDDIFLKLQIFIEEMFKFGACQVTLR